MMDALVSASSRRSTAPISTAANEVAAAEGEEKTLAEGEEKASAALSPIINFYLVRLPVVVNPHLPFTQLPSSISPRLSSTHRTPTSARSVHRQARLSRRTLSPTGRVRSNRPTTAVHVLQTPTPPA